ncbi:MAG: DUF2959 family protein [Phycisphaera sp.]|nr:DUF2959 family protein [Phycisphaera sp.]
MNRLKALCPVFLVVAALFSGGCKSIYYGTMETFGYQKRDILVERVEDARDEQTAAKKQFASALEQFRSVVKYEGGELEAKYDKLRSELSASEDRAAAVRDRIKSVDKVATDLFGEWEKELAQYSSEDYRRRSEDQLRATKERYRELLTKMQNAESKMEPVLVIFRDQVLFLKHNLNARALASLSDVATDLDKQVATLVNDMQKSIDEANDFIKTLEQ